MNEQGTLDDLLTALKSQATDETVVSLDRYRQDLAVRAAITGQESARAADPDAFDAAVETIMEYVSTGQEFDADDVRATARVSGLGPAVGAAFAAVRKAGVIESVGYAISSAPSRHGGVIRRWRAVRSP